jgi:hypothetical protein
MRALVVFHDHGNHVLARFLKPGFKHVFCALDDRTHWIRIDFMDTVPEVEVVAMSDYDLASFYRSVGFTVVETTQDDRGNRAPFTVANCVGLVKALLCLSAPFVWTPYRLYRYLRRSHG